MSETSNTPLRPWREIAREIVTEKNRDRLNDLAEQLNQAIETQGMGEPPATKPSK